MRLGPREVFERANRQCGTVLVVKGAGRHATNDDALQTVSVFEEAWNQFGVYLIWDPPWTMEEHELEGLELFDGVHDRPERLNSTMPRRELEVLDVRRIVQVE